MKEQVISFETAKLAKKKGFDLEVQYTYADDEGNADFFDDWENWNSYENNYSAPTQSLLQRWLREEHALHIVIIPTICGYWTYKIVMTNDSPNVEQPPYEEVHNIDYQTYEQALETALQEALKLIIT